MAQGQDDPALMIGAYNHLAATLYYLGDIGTAHQHVMRCVNIWRSGSVQSHAVEGEICKWHLGKIASCQALIDEAKELNAMSALALALQ